MPDPGVSHIVLLCGNESEGPLVALCHCRDPGKAQGLAQGGN